MYELVIIVHFATTAPHEEIVERNIKNYVQCLVKGMQRIGRQLGSSHIAFRCDKMKKQWPIANE